MKQPLLPVRRLAAPGRAFRSGEPSTASKPCPVGERGLAVADEHDGVRPALGTFRIGPRYLGRGRGANIIYCSGVIRH
jgi:hypothetical protein